MQKVLVICAVLCDTTLMIKNTTKHTITEGDFCHSDKFNMTVMVELIEEDTVHVSFPEGDEDETTLEDLTFQY